MDNGEKERAMTNSLKQIVKHTSRRKATTQLSKQRDPVVTIAPKSSHKPLEAPSNRLDTNPQHDLTPSSDHDLIQDDVFKVLKDGSTVSM
jgi:C6 transcription factor Pro1